MIQNIISNFEVQLLISALSAKELNKKYNLSWLEDGILIYRDIKVETLFQI